MCDHFAQEKLKAGEIYELAEPGKVVEPGVNQGKAYSGAPVLHLLQDLGWKKGEGSSLELGEVKP